MKKQLLDVTVVIGFVDDSGKEPYASSKIVRIDYEGTIDDVVEELEKMNGVVHMD